MDMFASHSAPRAAALFLLFATTTAFSIVACSSGDVKVGSSEQALQKKKDGGATGNGSTCSWDDSVSNDPVTGKDTVTPAASGGYALGETFKSLDGCNDCSCTAQGITCTEKACAPSDKSCTYAGKTYAPGQSYFDSCNTCTCLADGTASCTERYCPPACTEEAKQCPDGSYVSRQPPACDFKPCPTGVACSADAKQCPNGSFVGRVAPSCEFAPCP